MSITEAQYTNEAELDSWVAANIALFLPGSIQIPGFQVSTVSGKNGVPDGFAFNLGEQDWFVIEAELLSHGVWPHIAEQIIRFIVAMRNPATRRKIRDRLFENILAGNTIEAASTALGTTRERLLQQIELFIEGVEPQVVIFIDDTNEDLYDLARALSVELKIFRVKKFLVNGHPEYHSPDQALPVFVTEPEPDQQSEVTEFEVVNLLGGGQVEVVTGRTRLYAMRDGSRIIIRRSKYYPSAENYWYGITPSVIEFSKQHGVTHVVFVMGDDGLVKVPAATVWEFIKGTRVATNPDGSVRHYFCLISRAPEPELYYSDKVPRFALKDFYQAI